MNKMAIFSRRILQRLINENANVLLRRQVRKHVDDLNRMHETLSLASEWEVALLNAFSKVGTVVHEREMAGTADLYFEYHEDPTQNFVADVTAVSDKGFELRHPFDALDEELRRRVKDKGLNPNHFHLDVQGNHAEILRGHYYLEKGDDSNTLLYKGAVKAGLHMPGPAKFSDKIFNSAWERFLEERRDAPPYNVYRVYEPQERINISITFRPERYGSSSHLSYKQINHLTENRIYEVLEKKAGQLSQSKFDGRLGVIICDGGYTPFHAMPHFSTHEVKEVIAYFLRNNPSISFVLTLVIKSNSNYGSENKIVPTVYSNESIGRQDQTIVNIIGKMVNSLPQPESNAFNALNHLKGGAPQVGRKNGELTLSSNEIRISARTLMELLAGRLTHEEFTNRYEIGPSLPRVSGYTNFFDMRLKAGMLMSNVAIERSDTIDDDVITITLRGPDPAIHRFVVPGQQST